ncbi:MAG: hypothetical protein WC781_05655 [Candidatus Pacearchaeota archaeon]|jgi:hypothetical protein
MIIKAKQFYKEIEEEKESYKLVNGLFIVKYINQEECLFMGDFWKGGKLGDKKFNIVNIFECYSGIFNPSRKMYKTALSRKNNLDWKKLQIKFKEEPIEAILK